MQPGGDEVGNKAGLESPELVRSVAAQHCDDLLGEVDVALVLRGGDHGEVVRGHAGEVPRDRPPTVAR